MDRLRAAPADALGGLAVERVDDLAPRATAGLPPTDGLRYRLAGGAPGRSCGPSGTEPKLKCYLEVVVPVDAERPAGRRRADAAAGCPPSADLCATTSDVRRLAVRDRSGRSLERTTRACTASRDAR